MNQPLNFLADIKSFLSHPLLVTSIFSRWLIDVEITMITEVLQDLRMLLDEWVEHIEGDCNQVVFEVTWSAEQQEKKREGDTYS